MTAVEERGTTRGSKQRARQQPQQGVAPMPQVNLLPPEIGAARGVRRTQRWLGLGLVGVLVLCIAGYAGGLLVRNSAQDELTQTQADTSAIQAQTVQYAAVPRVLQELADAKQARQYGMALEVLWADYVGGIVAVLPPDVKIEAITSTLTSPVQAATLAPDPLQGDSLGQVQIIGRTTTLPDTARWIEGLDAIPGFADTRVTAMAVASDEDEGTNFYRVTLTVQVTEDALSGRFLPGGSLDPGAAGTTESEAG